MSDFAFVGRAPKRKDRSKWYRCSFCERNQQFASGRIVLSSDNGLRLIGDDCWSTYIDEDRWKAANREYGDYLDITRFAAVRDRLHTQAGKCIEEVRRSRVVAGNSFAFLQALPATLAAEAPEFVNLLQETRQQGGSLHIERMIPDPKMGLNEKGRPVRWIPEVEVLHRVQGINAALASDPKLSEMPDAIEQGLFDFRDRIAAVPIGIGADQAAAARAIRAIGRLLSEMAETARKIESAVEEGKRFLAAANLDGVARWSQSNDCDSPLAGRMEFIGYALRIRETGDRSFQLWPPVGLAQIQAPNLAELSRLLQLG